MTKKRVLPIEFIRFCLLGGASTLLGIALLFIFTDIVGIHYLFSFVTSYFIVNLFAYAASRRYIFAPKNNRFITGAIRYYAVNLFSLCVNAGALYMLVDWLRLPYLAASILLSALNAPINYILHKRISFALGGFPASLPEGGQ